MVVECALFGRDAVSRQTGWEISDVCRNVRLPASERAELVFFAIILLTAAEHDAGVEVTLQWRDPAGVVTALTGPVFLENAVRSPDGNATAVLRANVELPVWMEGLHRMEIVVDDAILHQTPMHVAAPLPTDVHHQR